MSDRTDQPISRRQFHRTAAATAALGSAAYGQGRSTVRIGWVGTGHRGGRDIRDLLAGVEGVELVAMADVLPDRMESARKMLDTHKELKGVRDKVKVTDDDCYVGFDGIDKVCAREDVDLVLHTTPPGFRPYHAMKLAEAGKHMVLEKPGGTDPVALRKLIEASELAEKKGLSIVVGTQQRRMPQYIELMKRVQDGEIGDIVAGDTAWHWSNANWHYHPKESGWSDMEWQIRSWPYFVWLGGDHVVEQHLHNLDVMDWALGLPNECLARGGRIARTDESYGNVYDHFSGVFKYDGGVRVFSAASQMNGTTGTVYESLIGTKGRMRVTRRSGQIDSEDGSYQWDGPITDAGRTQFRDLVGAIRNNEPINEGRRLAEVTGMAVTERVCAYSGRSTSYQWVMERSEEDLMWPAEKMRMGELPVRPVRIPGEYKRS